MEELYVDIELSETDTDVSATNEESDKYNSADDAPHLPMHLKKRRTAGKKPNVAKESFDLVPIVQDFDMAEALGNVSYEPRSKRRTAVRLEPQDIDQIVDMVFGTMFSVAARSRIYKLIDRISSSQRSEPTEDLLGSRRAGLASVDRALPGSIRDFCLIAILSGYVAQTALIRKAIASLNDTQLDQVAVSTIYAYQGEENSVVILIIATDKTIGFMKDPARLLVAITRGKSFLVITYRRNKARLCCPSRRPSRLPRRLRC